MQNMHLSWKFHTNAKISLTDVNTLRPIQNGRHFADDIFNCIFSNENAWISINISLKFVPRGQIDNIPSLVQIMAWRRPGDKPLSEPMMVSLLTHICVPRPQWVKASLRRGFSNRQRRHAPARWRHDRERMYSRHSQVKNAWFLPCRGCIGNRRVSSTMTAWSYDI